MASHPLRSNCLEHIGSEISTTGCRSLVIASAMYFMHVVSRMLPRLLYMWRGRLLNDAASRADSLAVRRLPSRCRRYSQ